MDTKLVVHNCIDPKIDRLDQKYNSSITFDKYC